MNRKIDYINIALILALIGMVCLFASKSYISVSSNGTTVVGVTLGKYVVNKVCIKEDDMTTTCSDLPGHKIYTIELKKEDPDRQLLYIRSE